MKNNKSLAIDENGYPIPRSEVCFKCGKKFYLKFVVPRKNYSLKNNWGYFTGKAEDENKWIDNLCLKNFYLKDRKEFLATVKDLKKRNNLISYIGKKFI